jgi:aromatase
MTSVDLVGHVDNSILIRAGFDLVWDVTNEIERWPELFTEYASVQVLDRTGDTVRFRLAMHPDENGVVWSWVSERVMDRDHGRVLARRIEPGPFEFMNIEWTYTAERDGTRMRWIQDFRMRPDAPIDTAAMAERINTNTAIQMDAIRRRLEQLGTDGYVRGAHPGEAV